jgi:uncharacterized membrane protein
MKKWISNWPWTATTKAVFLLLAVVAVIVGLIKEIDPNVLVFIGSGLGIGVAGTIGKRATTKVELEERSEKDIVPEHPDSEFTP